MKRLSLFLKTSLAANVLFVVLLAWSRRAHEAEIHRLAETAIRGDETHLSIHERALGVIDGTASAEESTEVGGLLRLMVATGRTNRPLRKDFLLGRAPNAGSAGSAGQAPLRR